MSNSTKLSGLFLKTSSDDDKYRFIDLSSNPTNPPFESLGVTITQSCNGLLLCVDNDESRNYSVFNPATDHRAALPPPPPHAGGIAFRSHPYGMSLAFDPSESPNFKAVCVRSFFFRREARFQIDIYSSETGSWRPSTLGPFELELNPSFDRGVFWNGCVHWMNEWDDFLRFEVDAERVHAMDMPPVPEDLELDDCERESGYFAVSGDRLHFVDRLVEYGESLLKVYEMGRDYSGWSVKYVVDASEVSRAFPEMIWTANNNPVENYYVSVLCVVRSEIEEESYVVINIPGKVLRYSFKDGTFSKLCDVPIVQGQMVFDPSQVFPYIQSVG